MLMFPEKIYYRDADAIYQYIQQYSRKASSFPSDRLLDLEGAFSSYRRDVPRYLYHFYGISIPVYISRDNDQSESRELLSVYSSGFSLSSTFSFLTGLAWTYNLKSRGQSNRLTTSRWTGSPSWSWSAGLEQVTTRKELLFDNFIHQDGVVSVSLTRCSGAEQQESLWDFASGQRTYSDYHP